MDMKKILKIALFTFFAFFCYNTVSAQSRLGVKGGQNISLVAFTPERNLDYLPGREYGLVFTHVHKGIAGIQLEVKYAEKGYSEKITGGGNSITTIQYIEIPFLTHLTFGKKSTKFLMNFGPYIGYGFNIAEPKVVVEVPENQNPAPEFNSWDFGMAVGMGVVQHLPIGTFQLEARVSHGLIDIYKFNILDGLNGSQNQVGGVSLAYLIGSSKKR
jgi:hypothetical protein